MFYLLYTSFNCRSNNVKKTENSFSWKHYIFLYLYSVMGLEYLTGFLAVHLY